MQHALTLPPYGDLADPSALVEIAVAAETAGWDAVFLWDHVLRRPEDPQETADPWAHGDVAGPGAPTCSAIADGVAPRLGLASAEHGSRLGSGTALSPRVP